jgi:hypothetical protein
MNQQRTSQSPSHENNTRHSIAEEISGKELSIITGGGVPVPEAAGLGDMIVDAARENLFPAGQVEPGTELDEDALQAIQGGGAKAGAVGGAILGGGVMAGIGTAYGTSSRSLGKAKDAAIGGAFGVVSGGVAGYKLSVSVIEHERQQNSVEMAERVSHR